MDHGLIRLRRPDFIWATRGTGVDGAVRRIAMSYEVRGMRENLTSYDHATVGSGSIVNDVQFEYNDFSQLTHDYQAHGGAVNTSTSPKVQYGYASGSANTIRPTTLTYPDGRVLTYGYGTADGINDACSRIASLIDDDVSSTHLVDYSYLGIGRPANSVNSPMGSGFVIADYTQPEIKWTMADLSGSNDPDTGDIYSGFDRFGRVKDNRWYGYGAMADADRIKYGYDRSGNRIWRQNVVADSIGSHFDELYSNDLINRLKDLERGTLNANKDAVTDKTFAECWSLDPTGNWKKFLQDDDGDGTWDLDQSRTANEVNEITDISESTGPSWITPAYNKAGNMTTIPQPSDPTKSYTATYDAWNRLVKLVDGTNTVSEYEYDGAKRRTIQKSYVTGTLDETRHLYYTDPSKWQVIEERIGTSTDPAQQHIWGLRYIDDLVLRDRDTTGNGTLDERLYGMQDANWNVTSLCDTNGTIQERYAYSAYGSPMFLTPSFGARASSNYNWQTVYASYRWETATELFHIRNRVFNSPIGSWVQRDPLGIVVGYSLYEYTDSIPLFSTDPSGLGPNQEDAGDWSVVIKFICDLEWQGGMSHDEMLERARDHFSAGQNRYVYTEDFGWIDLRHFFEAADYANAFGNTVTQCLGFLNECNQYRRESWTEWWGTDVYNSGFSQEDLPSNSAGAGFGDGLYCHGSLCLQLKQWVKDHGGLPHTDPNSGFGDLPATDPNAPPGGGVGSNSSNDPPGTSNSGPGSDSVPGADSGGRPIDQPPRPFPGPYPWPL